MLRYRFKSFKLFKLIRAAFNGGTRMIYFRIFKILLIGAQFSSCKTANTNDLGSKPLGDQINFQRTNGELGKCSTKHVKYKAAQATIGVVIGLVGAVSLSSTIGTVLSPFIVGGVSGLTAVIPPRDDLCGLQDLDFARYPGDWSLRRVKRSCPPYFPVAAAKHVDSIEFNLGCAGDSISPAIMKKIDENAENKRDVYSGIALPPQYRYVENGNVIGKWGYSLDCADNEYVAGISFGVSNSNYGIKSILCAKIPAGGQENGCRYLGDGPDECGKNQYMRGMYVERGYRNRNIGGFVGSETTKRADDGGEYGDQIKGITCCSMPTYK
jgi:hypothetical protein